MLIKVANCNNIDEANISLTPSKLNIKYAMNGTGKSTVVKAIKYKIEDEQKLEELRPFKHYNDKSIVPSIEDMDSFSTVKIFDEDYIEQFVFQRDELLKGSFNILIKNEEYERGLRDIEQLVSDIKKLFLENDEINNLIQSFTRLIDSYGNPKSNGIHGASPMSKAFGSGNLIRNIPDKVINYKQLIQSDKSLPWVKWQIEGRDYLNISQSCPYCTSGVDEKLETIDAIKDIYKPKTIEHLHNILKIFTELKEYFSLETQKKIDLFIGNINGYTKDEEQYLLDIKEQVQRLKNKLVQVQSIGFNSLKDVEKIIDQLKEMKIDLSLYFHLNSTLMNSKIEIINSKINLILEKAGVIQGKINIQKRLIEKMVQLHKVEINAFLENAGYRYKVDIIDDGKGELKLKLVHLDSTNEVLDVDKKLSYGERNAFALVLFMYDVIKCNPSLVILDDPISSFDKNKKYAIIEMLFQSSRSLRGKTVLMMTHDFTPIIDMILHHRNIFDLPSAYFLENSNGILTEKEIEKNDIQTYFEITRANVFNLSNDINKCVYLRRYYELTDDKGLPFQILSSLFHKRNRPTFIDNTPLTSNEVRKGVRVIRKWIPQFQYRELIKIVTDRELMIEIYNSSSSNYEKLHIFRIIFDDDFNCHSSIRKYINEAFHIENDFIYQLNPCSFQMVPQYIIDVCDDSVNINLSSTL